jgi:23S rRNA (cytosine1962-C5)-methyltransferase
VLEVLARHGCPVVGDAGRGGPAATQLLLHLSGVLGDVEVRAPLPSPIESWLSGEASRPPEQFESALDDAGVQRFWLESQCQAFRLVGEAAGDLAGLTVDRYGDFAVVATSSERAERVVEPLAEYLLSRGVRGVYLKRRLRADLRRLDPHALSPPTPIRGEPAPERLVLRQHGLRFEVRLADGASTGLFLDQRANWLRLQSAARGRSLLNLFAYTGAFTLFAAAGGASSTLSVDLSSRALGRLATNLEQSGLSGDCHRLLRHDVVRWLQRAGRQQRRFDWIVLDPPSFGTRGRKVLSTARDQAELLASAASLLAPRGRLLCVSHQRRNSLRDLCRQVLAAAAAVGREARVEPWLGTWDCPTLPGVSHVRSVLLTVG